MAGRNELDEAAGSLLVHLLRSEQSVAIAEALPAEALTSDRYRSVARACDCNMPLVDQHPVAGSSALSCSAALSTYPPRKSTSRFLAIGSWRSGSHSRDDYSAKYRGRDIPTRGRCETRARADNQRGAGARRLAPIQSKTHYRAQFPGTDCRNNFARSCVVQENIRGSCTMAQSAHFRTAAVVFAAALALTPVAHAQNWRHDGHHSHHGGGNAAGAAIIGGIVGLGVGAAIASGGGYYAPPPVYYGAPPGYYYAPPPPVYYGYGY